MDKYILIVQKKSSIKQTKIHKLLLRHLGLKKINEKKIVKNTLLIRNKIFKIQHLVSIKNTYI